MLNIGADSKKKVKLLWMYHVLFRILQIREFLRGAEHFWQGAIVTGFFDVVLKNCVRLLQTHGRSALRARFFAKVLEARPRRYNDVVTVCGPR